MVVIPCAFLVLKGVLSIITISTIKFTLCLLLLLLSPWLVMATVTVTINVFISSSLVMISRLHTIVIVALIPVSVVVPMFIRLAIIIMIPTMSVGWFISIKAIVRFVTTTISSAITSAIWVIFIMMVLFIVNIAFWRSRRSLPGTSGGIIVPTDTPAIVIQRAIVFTTPDVISLWVLVIVITVTLCQIITPFSLAMMPPLPS
mmetsp:Transcript_37741/g.46120  ORF Transcript_37741/g.46120 Transcript_37741/m.46120 type:complete len:202 (-) Transcript_37741:395-1000(-)